MIGHKHAEATPRLILSHSFTFTQRKVNVTLCLYHVIFDFSPAAIIHFGLSFE